MVALLEKLKKEWHVIRAAPWSFLIVCAVATTTIGGTFRYIYREKLADSDRRTTQWKNDAEYWKDMANRPKDEKQKDNPQAVAPSKPILEGHKKMPPPTQNAPGGINVGRDLTGTAIVNNVPPPLTMTAEQAAHITQDMRTFAGKSVQITANNGTPEMLEFIDKLKMALTKLP